jgi:hypothetical protein
MGLGSSVVTAYCRWPSHPGKRQLANTLANWLLPEQGMLVTFPDGIRLWLHPTEPAEYAVLVRQNTEPVTHAFLKANLKPGQLALSSGIGIGRTLITLSKIVGPTGKVVGIESRPASLLRAQGNLNANELPDNIILVAGQLGAQPGVHPNDEINSVEKSSPKNRHAIHVIIESLPELLYRLSLRRADLLILENAGHEKEILKGITPASRPHVVIFKVTKGTDANSTLCRLAELGYRTFDLQGNAATDGMPAAEKHLVATDRDDLIWMQR